jgi:polygalacturonase
MSLTKVSFSMINGSVFNVLDYGAVGDGVTPDSAAINAAILDANVKGGGVVFFPVGVYKLNAQILLKPGVSLIGEQKGEWGAGVTPGVEFSKEFLSGSVFYSPNTQTIASVSYENFWIEGNKGGLGGSNGNGIQNKLCNDVIYSRVCVKE